MFRSCLHKFVNANTCLANFVRFQLTIDVTNVYKRFIKKRKNAFLTFFNSVNVFFNFQPVKITQITFPDSSNIGNILTIKDNDI